MKKWMPIAIVLTGVLFPFGWAARFSTTTAALFDRAFSTQFSHVVMHALLFASLALCMMKWCAERSWRRAATIALIAAACAGLGQEAIQAISAGVLRVGDTLFDLGVDLAAAGLGVRLGVAIMT
jgi:hypothetical protein